MQSEEQRLIDGLFGRLKEAETKTGQRDLQAEQLINQHIREQPSAPYYMAQAMIIQEAALKQLDQRVKIWRTRLPSSSKIPPANRAAAVSWPGCSAAAIAIRQARATNTRRNSKIMRPGTISRRRVMPRSSHNKRHSRQLHLLGPAGSSAAHCKLQLAWPAAWYWPTC